MVPRQKRSICTDPDRPTCDMLKLEQKRSTAMSCRRRRKKDTPTSGNDECSPLEPINKLFASRPSGVGGRAEKDMAAAEEERSERREVVNCIVFIVVALSSRLFSGTSFCHTYRGQGVSFRERMSFAPIQLRSDRANIENRIELVIRGVSSKG